MDDGSGVLLPYMTLQRTFMRQHADAGLEAVAALTEYQHDFAQQINARMNGVDLTIPENQPFKAAVGELQEEFSQYIDKIPFSNPMALQALASQVSQFDAKLAKLPKAYRKTKLRKTPKVHKAPEKVDPLQVSDKAQEAVPAPQITAY